MQRQRLGYSHSGIDATIPPCPGKVRVTLRAWSDKSRNASRESPRNRNPSVGLAGAVGPLKRTHVHFASRFRLRKTHGRDRIFISVTLEKHSRVDTPSPTESHTSPSSRHISVRFASYRRRKRLLSASRAAGGFLAILGAAMKMMGVASTRSRPRARMVAPVKNEGVHQECTPAGVNGRALWSSYALPHEKARVASGSQPRRRLRHRASLRRSIRTRS